MKERNKEASVQQMKAEIRQQIYSNVYNPFERNHKYKVEVSKNPAEKERAKQAKSQWKSSARSKYGANWKILTRQNGYGGI